MARYKDTAVENPKGLALLVPGISYPCEMPQLYFAKQVALAHGYNVREMAWDPGMEWEVDRVCAEVASVLEDNELPVLLMAKSIGTLSSVYAAENKLPAVWITPMGKNSEVVAAIAVNPQPQFTFAGTKDQYWDLDAPKSWPEHVKVLQLPGADHSTLIAGDPVRSAEIVAEYTRAMDSFVASL